MQDLYEVLGLAPGADQERVKAAFRERAKRFHPDLNVGDIAAEQRFKELGRAYEVLSDPEARAAYDRRVRRGPVRRRWPAVATSLATFLLTVGLAASAIVWTRDTSVSQSGTGVSQSGTGEAARAPTVAALAAGSAELWDLPDVEAPPTSERNEAIRASAIGPPAETSASIEPTPQAASTGSVPLQSRGDPEDSAPAGPGVERLPAPDASLANWTTYRSARFGFALRYPGEVFAAAEATPGDSPVRTFMSPDGRAMLHIMAGPIAPGLTLPKYRRTVMEQRYGGATYDYTPQQGHWFVLSGTRGEEMFYERITFSCDGRSLHGWQLRYPLADRAFYDRIVEAMHRGYRHSNGPGARCVEGKGEATALSKPQAASKEPPAAQF